jgi:formylmethanofuran dehydrogenase subunit B
LQPEIAVVAADSTGPLSYQWEAQANEASAVTVSAESAADAVFQSDARVSFASGKILRNGKQAGTDVGRV